MKPKAIEHLLKGTRARGYFYDGIGRVGIRHQGIIHWYSWSRKKGQYIKTGSTKYPGAFTDYRRIR